MGFSFHFLILLAQTITNAIFNATKNFGALMTYCSRLATLLSSKFMTILFRGDGGALMPQRCLYDHCMPPLHWGSYQVNFAQLHPRQKLLLPLSWLFHHVLLLYEGRCFPHSLSHQPQHQHLLMNLGCLSPPLCCHMKRGDVIIVLHSYICPGVY